MPEFKTEDPESFGLEQIKALACYGDWAFDYSPNDLHCCELEICL
jgi:hypothetical protein